MPATKSSKNWKKAKTKDIASFFFSSSTQSPSASSTNSSSPSPVVVVPSKKNKRITLSFPSSSQEEEENNNNNNNNDDKGKRRRRCRMAPPARLAWPGHLSQTTATTTATTATTQKSISQSSSSKPKQPQPKQRDNDKDESLLASSRPPKRRRGAEMVTQSIHSNKNAMWIDKHRPIKSSDLVVAPKKVKQVTTWLQGHNNNSGGLLILIGAPGVGKSTMVQLLAQEMDLEVAEWTESYYQFMAAASYASGGSRNDYMEFQTPLQHWQQFMQQNSIGYKSLQVETTTQEDSSAAAAAEKDNNRSQAAAKKPATKRKLQMSTAAAAKQSKRTQQQQQQQQPGHRQRLIVIDELPHCHSAEHERLLRETLTRHVCQSQVPTVWIWSHNVLEGKQHNPADLEARLDAKVLYDQTCVTQCTIHPATVARFQATLKRIAPLEPCLQRLQNLPTLASEWHATSGGDIRFALNALQYRYGDGGEGAEGDDTAASNRKRPQQNKNNSSAAERDVRLSAFHALGKVLYAKRKKRSEVSPAEQAHQEAPLDFDPEGALEHSGMELPASIHFIQYHSLDFFTDVSELSVAWDLYSDAAQLLDVGRTTGGGGGGNSNPLHAAVAASLAGRAVAYSNHHPAPNKFRQFTKPKSFQVMTRRKANQWQLDQYYRSSAGGPVMRFQHSKQAFATDMYPHGRKIYQRKFNGQDGQQQQQQDQDDSDGAAFWLGAPLQSFLAGSQPQEVTPTTNNDSDDDENVARQREQEQVLAQDDIVDFDE